MDTLLFYIKDFAENSTLFEFFTEMAVKGTAVLLIAFGAVVLWKQASANIRHLVLSVAILCLILLPVLTVMLPSWEISLSAVETPAEIPASPLEKPTHKTGLTTGLNSLLLYDLPVKEIQVPETSFLSEVKNKAAGYFSVIKSFYTNINFKLILIPLWLFGVAVLFFKFWINLFGPWLMVKQAEPVRNKKLNTMLRSCSEKLGIRQNVRLLESRWVKVPMEWGWFKPCVVLPLDSEKWSDERKEVVLLHELAHVKRVDFWATLSAHFVSIFHWFNPLVWLALRKLHLEREYACDDYVLSAGVDPAEYADNLVDMARKTKIRIWSPNFELSLAKKINLEERVMAILNNNRTRNTAQPLTKVFIIVLAVSFLTPLACMTPWSKKDKPDEITVVEETKTEPEIEAVSIPEIEMAAISLEEKAISAREIERALVHQRERETRTGREVRETDREERMRDIRIEQQVLNEVQQKKQQEELVKQLNELKKQLDEQQKVVNELSKNTNMTEEQEAELAKALQELRKTIRAYESLLASRQMILRNREAELSQERIRQMVEKYTQQMQSNEKMQEQIRQMTEEMNRLYQSDEYKKQIQEMQKFYQSDEYKKQMEEIQQKYQGQEYQKRIQEFQKQFQSQAFKQQMQELQNSLKGDEYKKQMELLQKQFQSQEFKQQMEKMMQNQNMLQQEFQQKNSQIQKKEQELLQKKLDVLKKAINTKQQEIEKLEEEVKTDKSKEKELQAAKEELKKLAAEYEAFIKANPFLKKEIDLEVLKELDIKLDEMQHLHLEDHELIHLDEVLDLHIDELQHVHLDSLIHIHMEDLKVDELEVLEELKLDEAKLLDELILDIKLDEAKLIEALDVKLDLKELLLDDINLIIKGDINTQTVEGIRSTTFDLPLKGNVKAEIFNTVGQMVTTRYLTDLPAGENTFIWDGLDDDGKKVASGVYIVKLTGEDLNVSKKIQVIKDSKAPEGINIATFDLPLSGDVKADVFNVMGQRITSQNLNSLPSGKNSFKWDGIDEEGKKVESGVYFVRFTGDGLNVTEKIIIIN
ncbi:M56 family metallopeptidase [candidate division KSB1 bacterium]